MQETRFDSCVFPDGSEDEEYAHNAGDLSMIPGLGRSLEKGIATHSQGRGSLVGCRLWGHTESEMTEAT